MTIPQITDDRAMIVASLQTSIYMKAVNKQIVPATSTTTWYYWVKGMPAENRVDGTIFRPSGNVFLRQGSHTSTAASGAANTIPRSVYVEAEPGELAWLVLFYCPAEP